MRLLVLSFLLVLFNSFTSNAFLVKDPSKGTSTLNVYFDSDQADLKSDEKMRIDQLMADQTLETIKITLVGHTDADGDDGYNVRLSKKRVNAVKEYLIGLGFDPEKIEIDYRGEKEPVAENEQDAGKAANRRVSIEWDWNDPSLNEPVETFGDINDIYKTLGPESQSFTIINNRDTVLTLEQGTILMIPEGTFRGKKVTLSVQEVYDYSDMVLANLGTTSGGNLLETAGMINLDARDGNGNKVNIRKDKEVTIFFPNEGELNNDMQLFNGVHDDAINSQDWTVPRNNRMLRIRPANFYWPYLIGCGDYCGFRCRLFGKKDFASVNELENARLTTIKDYNKESKSCANQRYLYWDEASGEPQNWKDLKAKYGATTWQELRAAMEKEYMEKQEKKMEDGTATMAEASYYIGRTVKMGWINCDAFSNYRDGRKITMVTDIESDSETDGQLIFTKRKSIMKANRSGKLSFAGIVTGLSAWFVSIRFKDGRIYLAMKKVKTSEELGAIEFKEVSADELKEALQEINA